MSSTPKGILLVNLGTPDDPSRASVYRYLKEFLLDKRVIDYNWLLRNFLVRGIIAPFRSKPSSEAYKELWTEQGSPLKFHGEKVSEMVQENLGEEYMVQLAMRYQSPAIKQALLKFKEHNITDITVFPMFPQYASASTGSVFEEVMDFYRKELTIPSLRFIQSYHDNPLMIEAFANRAEKYNLEDYDHFIFSFHGLPERHLKNADENNHCVVKKDCCTTICEKNHMCYGAQSHATAYAIADKLGIHREDLTVSFQSRLGKEVWMTPYTIDVLEECAKKGQKKILVFSPAFVADCLETTIEIGDEYKEEFLEFGGEELDYVESLNDHPKWVEAIVGMVK